MVDRPEIKPTSVLKFGIGFQRNDTLLNCNGILKYHIKIFSKSSKEVLSLNVNLENYEKKNLYYEYHSIDLSKFSDSLITIQFWIDRKYVNTSIHVFYLNPYLELT